MESVNDSLDDLPESEPTVNNGQVVPKRCNESNCNMLFDADLFCSEWKCCEECGRWFCAVCAINNMFNTDSEFKCKIC